MLHYVKSHIYKSYIFFTASINLFYTPSFPQSKLSFCNKRSCQSVATCIAEAIKVNKTLTNLNLRNNGIGDAGATCIAEAIKVNKTQTNLDLRSNGISDAGATCIAEAIKINKTLTFLDL